MQEVDWLESVFEIALDTIVITEHGPLRGEQQ